MTEEYFEDIELNATYRSRVFKLEEADMIQFAKEWNPEPYHIDPVAARKSKIGGIFAAGPHLIAITVKLTNEKRPLPAVVAGMGWDELRFLTPGRPGDCLVVESEVISKRLSESDPRYGIVTYAVRLLNQNNDPVLTYRVTVMVKTRRAG